MKTRYISILLSAVLVLGSCIKEDYSDCPPPPGPAPETPAKYLYLKSRMNKYVYEDVVEKIALYIYDADGAHVNTTQYTKQQLVAEDYLAEIKGLNEGQYTVVGIVNGGNDYSTAYSPHIDNFSSTLIPDNGDTVTRKQSDIFQGYETITVDHKVDSKDNPEIMHVWKNTNNFNVKIELDGYQLPAGHEIRAFIKGDNGATDKFNDAIPGNVRLYMSLGRQHPDDKTSVDIFRTMKIWVGSNLTLVVREVNAQGQTINQRELNIPDILAGGTGVTRAEGDIYDTNEKLWQEDEYYISIKIGASFALIVTSIKDWTNVEDPGIIV